MEDFNGDNSKVDAALKTLANQVASKANSSTVSSLTTKVNTKAAQSDLTAAVNRISALESGKADMTALTAEQTAREAADTALRNENCWVKLGTWSFPSATATLALDFSGVTPSNYRVLALEFAVTQCRGNDICVTLNNVSTASYYLPTSGSALKYFSLPTGYKFTRGRLELRDSLINGQTVGQYAYFTANSGNSMTNFSDSAFTATIPYAQLSSIQLVSNLTGEQFSGGSSFTLYGLKK